MNTARSLYELTRITRQRLDIAARDGRAHPLQPSWCSLSGLLYYALHDHGFYQPPAVENPSERQVLLVSVQSGPEGSLTIHWHSPRSWNVGSATLLQAPAHALFDEVSSSDATQPSYDDDYALFAELAAAVYRSVVGRFEERFAVKHESWLVLHRSPVGFLEAVAADDFASEPVTSDARSQLEAYTGMRVSYIRRAFKRALFVYPILCDRLERVSGRSLDRARLRALCQAYVAEHPGTDDGLMNIVDAT